jgi:hypothetical protein
VAVTTSAAAPSRAELVAHRVVHDGRRQSGRAHGDTRADHQQLGAWSAIAGGICDGTESASHATMTFSSVTADKACLHTFALPIL